MNKRTGQTQEEMPVDFNVPADELAISLRYTHTTPSQSCQIESSRGQGVHMTLLFKSSRLGLVGLCLLAMSQAQVVHRRASHFR